MNLEFLRNWKRSQLLLLKEFIFNPLVSQKQIEHIGGFSQGSHALGGQITSLSRANLIIKAGKDINGQKLWQLNEKQVDKEELKRFLVSLEI